MNRLSETKDAAFGADSGRPVRAAWRKPGASRRQREAVGQSRAGTKMSRWPLVLMALTSPAFSMSSTSRAARL